MREIRIDTDEIQGVVTIPDNCRYPILYPEHDCVAVNRRNPECDCRWCVFNKEFGQAHGREREE